MTAPFQVTVDARSPRALGLFWLAALEADGYAVDTPPGSGPPDAAAAPEEVLERWRAFLVANDVPPEQLDSAFALVDPAGRSPRIFFQQVPEPKTAKNRVHLDLRRAGELRGPERMTFLEQEAARLVALGATRTGRVDPGPTEYGFVVMADPEGHEFCLT